MSDPTFPGDRPIEPDRPHPERVTRGDLVRGDAEKVVSEHTEHVKLFKVGGVNATNLRDLVDQAKLLATAGPMLPAWLQGNVGGCYGICLKAREFDISPLSLAEESYVVENRGEQRVAYGSKFYHALIEKLAPITTRLNVEYEGEGDNRRCRVFATFQGEREPRYWPPKDSDPNQFTLARLRPARNEQGKIKGSPLWGTKPDLQLFYNMSRDWARVYIPDIVLGMVTKEEMEDAGFTVASETAKDMSPRLAERLKGSGPPIGQAALTALEASAAEHAAKTKPKTEATDAPAGA